MGWGYHKCLYCKFWQAEKNRTRKGLRETSGELHGGKHKACTDFRLREDIRAILPAKREA